jgi:hypothetical protein
MISVFVVVRFRGELLWLAFGAGRCPWNELPPMSQVQSTQPKFKGLGEKC